MSHETRYFNPGYPGSVYLKEKIQEYGGTILREENLWIYVSWPDVQAAIRYDGYTGGDRAKSTKPITERKPVKDWHPYDRD